MGDVGFRVATAFVGLTIDDSDIEDQIVEAVSAACSAAGAVGGDVLMQMLARAAASGGDEIAGGLAEAVAGAGDAMGAEISASLASSLATTGTVAGDEISQQLVEAVSGAGDEAGAELAQGIEGPVSLLGSELAELLSTGLQAGLEGIDSEVSAVMQQLPAVVDPAATYAGLHIGGALAAGIGGMGSAASVAIAGSLTAAAVDAAAEAGGAAGGALAAAIGDSAAPAMATAAAKAGKGLEASLTDVMAQAGASGGDALAAGVAVGVDAHAGDVAQKIAEAVQAPLEVSMTQVGMAGGDAITAGMAAAAGVAEEEGHAAFIEFASVVTPAVEEVGEAAGPVLMSALGESSAEFADLATVAFSRELEEAIAQAVKLVGDTAGTLLVLSLGESAAESADLATVAFSDSLEGSIDQAMALAGEEGGVAYATGWRDSALAGIDVIAQGISSTGTPFPGGAAAADQAQAAAEAAAAAEAEELAAAFEADEQYLQEGIDRFTALGGQALDEWLEQVQLASESARDAFITVYEAVNAQLGATTALTDEQAAALDLMYFRASAEMSSLMDEAIAFNASIKSLNFTPSSMTINAPLGGYSEEEMTTMVNGFEKTGAAAEKAAASVSHLGGGMGMASMAAFGLISFAPQMITSLQSLSGAADQTGLGVNNVEASFLGLQSTTPGLAANIGQVGQALSFMSGVFGQSGGDQGMQDLDNALAQLQATDPQLAAEKVATLTAALKAQGDTPQQIAQYLSVYDTAVQNSAISLAAQAHAIADTVPGTQSYATSVQTATVSLEAQALQTTETAAATRAYLASTGPGTQAYTNAINNQVVALESQARTAQIAAEALNESLAPQAQLSQEAITASLAYTQAQQATSAYTNSLTALYGQYGATSGAEAAVTTALSGLTTTVKSGKDAVDQYTTAGAANITAFEGVATAAYTAAGDIYQTTGSASQANTALQTMATRLDTAASKAGLTKKQVQELNTELFGVPTVKDITINLDTSHATNSLADLLKTIDTSSGTVKVYENSGGGVGSTQGGPKANAMGGPVQYREPVLVGDGGRTEMFVPDSPGWVYPSVDDGMKALAAGRRPGVTVNQHFYGPQLPNGEQSAQMRRELATVGAF